MVVSRYIGAGIAVGLGASTFWYWNTEAKVKKGPYFEKSMDLLKGYKPVTDIIGEPIRPQMIELGDKFNILNEKIAKLAIPVAGTKGKGILYTWASKPENSSEWQVDKLDIEITDPSKRRWTFYLKENQSESKSDT